MASNSYKRYLWLVRTISQSREGLTLKEIKDRWLRSGVNDGSPLSRRTFHNWITAVGDTMGIDIECTHCAPFRYHIADSSQMRDGLTRWVLDAFAMGLLLSDNAGLHDRILLEDIPSADERLETILAAMRNNHCIRMTYRPFGRDEMTVTTEPYAVKLSRKRWYVICHSQRHGREFVYGIDRIIDVVETDETFKVPKDYSAARDYESSIGISPIEGIAIEQVRLKITGYLRDYIDTLPLHASQRLVERTPDHTIYAYSLRPDRELVDIITGLGSCCEVLTPQSLRDKVRESGLSIAAINK